MHVHTLTANDEWFILEGQIDPLSRTRFAVGHNVVVCPNKHVLLADFYDGVCPQCHSNTTVAFTRANAIRGTMRSYAGTCPKCFSQVSILFQQQVGEGIWKGICPSCKRSVEVNNERFFSLQQIQRKQRAQFKQIQASLRWILALLVVVCLGITYMGEGSRTITAEHYTDAVDRKLLTAATGFRLSDKVAQRFLTVNRAMYSRTSNLVFENHSLTSLSNNSREVLEIIAAGIPVLGHNSQDRLDLMLLRNRELVALFGRRTHVLGGVISVWIEETRSRFK